MSSQQVVDSINNVRYNHVNETLDTVIPQLFNNIELAGFQIVGDTSLTSEEFEKNVKACSLIVESVRAVLMDRYNMYHPFQMLADNIFCKNNDESYGLAPKLEMDFEELEKENNHQNTDD